MAADKHRKNRYDSLHRYLTGLAVFCFVISALAMWIVGGTDIFTVSGCFELTVWSTLILFILILAKRILIRSWAMWEGVRGSDIGKAKAR